MDFTFIDVSNSFVQMVQQDLPREVMSDMGTAGSRNQSFAQKLSKILEKVEPLKETSFPAKPDQTTRDSGKRMDHLSKKLSQEKGVNFISALKNIFLMVSKGDLKNVSIDADGLEALKKMLLKAGFKENDINDLFVELSEGLENKNPTLDDLLDKLFNLPFEAISEKETEQENFLETSALPFLESILNSLGIPKEKIQEVLIEADKGEKGISLDVVIEKLQNLQKKSFYTPNHFRTRDGDDSFKLLFKQMGFEQAESKTTSLTLDGLISSLEQFHRKISQQQAAAEVPSENDPKLVANEKPLDLFKALFKGLELKNKPKEPQVFGFSYEQMKSQFKTVSLIPGEEKTNKNVKHAPDTKLKEGFKEMESLLNGKKEGSVDVKNQGIADKGFLKQMKSGNAKLSDQTQISVSDAKTSETQSDLNILKTKSSFKNLPTYVTQQVSKSLVRAINQGENILRIQLKPPELGRLLMTLDHTGNSMKVSIMTENHAAKEILSSNVTELRTILSNSGVNLERFDVDMNSNFRQSMANARNQTGNSGKRHRNKGNSINGEDMNGPVSLLEVPNQDGSLHFVA